MVTHGDTEGDAGAEIGTVVASPVRCDLCQLERSHGPSEPLAGIDAVGVLVRSRWGCDHPASM